MRADSTKFRDCHDLRVELRCRIARGRRSSSVQSTTKSLREAKLALNCSSPLCVQERKIQDKGSRGSGIFKRTGAKLVLDLKILSQADGKEIERALRTCCGRSAARELWVEGRVQI